MQIRLSHTFKTEPGPASTRTGRRLLCVPPPTGARARRRARRASTWRSRRWTANCRPSATPPARRSAAASIAVQRAATRARSRWPSGRQARPSRSRPQASPSRSTRSSRSSPPRAGSPGQLALAHRRILLRQPRISDLYTGLTGGVPMRPGGAAQPHDDHPGPTYTPDIDPGIAAFDAPPARPSRSSSGLTLQAGVQYYLPGLDGRLWVSGNYSRISCRPTPKDFLGTAAERRARMVLSHGAGQGARPRGVVGRQHHGRPVPRRALRPGVRALPRPPTSTASRGEPPRAVQRVLRVLMGATAADAGHQKHSARLGRATGVRLAT